MVKPTTAKSGKAKRATKVVATERYQPGAGAASVKMETAVPVTMVAEADNAGTVKAVGKPTVARAKTASKRATNATKATAEPGPAALKATVASNTATVKPTGAPAADLAEAIVMPIAITTVAAAEHNMALLKVGREAATIALKATTEPIVGEARVIAKPVSVAMSEANRALLTPVSPELAALTGEINTLACDLRRLAKGATRTAVQLGERLSDLFDHASDGAWDTLVRRTGVNVRDAASLVTFAEGLHGLIERLSPVQDVPLREVLNHLVALARALSLTSGNPR